MKALLAAAAFLGIGFSDAASAQEKLNILPGVTPLNIGPDSGLPTRGVVRFTADINANGTVAACFGCIPAKTFRIDVGRYIVDFGQNVTALKGWSRWVEPDTLQTGFVGTDTNPGAWCNTADSATFFPNAVWVNCQHAGGAGSQGNAAFFDTSFFLFVAR
jgi:hypothetical protein